MSRFIRLCLAFFVTTGASHGAVATNAVDGVPGQVRPQDFVDISEKIPSISLDIRYAGDHNFVGRPIDGYLRPVCLLTRPAARALQAVQAQLLARQLSLKVYDCYRPQRAVAHFVRWAADLADTAMKGEFYPSVPKTELFARGYIAARSGHSRGSTLDLTIAGLDMGTPYDLFDPLSHTDNPDISTEASANRHLLREVMEEHGFRNLPEEWWHYTLINEPYPDNYFDFPIE